jgi:predicted DNA-binding protein (MmcQ/YjbR family)
MDYGRFHAAALALPGTRLDIKWGADRVYVVGEKMFATAGGIDDPAPTYAFKASDMAFELLVEHGLAKPSPYLAKARWVKLNGPDALADQELLAYLAQAHAIVAAKLPAKRRRELGIAL